MRGQADPATAVIIATLISALIINVVTPALIDSVFDCKDKIVDWFTGGLNVAGDFHDLLILTGISLNQGNRLIDSAESLEEQIYQSALYSGFANFTFEINKVKPSELLSRLRPEQLDTYVYEFGWGVMITDYKCNFDNRCIIVCTLNDCSNHGISIGVRPPQSLIFDLVREKTLASLTKYELFMDTVEAVTEDIKKKQVEVRESYQKFDGEAARLSDEFGLGTYSRVIQEYNSLRIGYCSTCSPFGNPNGKLSVVRVTLANISIEMNKLSNGDPPYSTSSPYWLFNRYNSLVSAERDMASVERILGGTDDILKEHNKNAEELLESVRSRTLDSISKVTDNRDYYESAYLRCESGSNVWSEKISDARCMVDTIITPIKSGSIDIYSINNDLAFTKNMIQIAASGYDEEFEFLGEQVRGEDFGVFLSPGVVDEIWSEFDEIETATKSIPTQNFPDSLDSLIRVREKIVTLREDIYIKTNTAHKKFVNEHWEEINLVVPKLEARIMWLKDKGIKTETTSNEERGFILENSKYLADDFTAHRAFGHMNRLRVELQQMIDSVNTKVVALKPLIAEHLEVDWFIIPPEAELNKQTELTMSVSIDNPFPDDEYEKHLVVVTPVKELVEDITVGKTGYQNQFKFISVPITGTESVIAHAQTFPVNLLKVTRMITYQSPFESDLIVDPGFLPYDWDCKGYECELRGKKIIFKGLSGSGTIYLELLKDDPVEVKLGERQGNRQIIVVSNNVKIPYNATINLILNETQSTLVDQSTGFGVPLSVSSGTGMVSFDLELGPMGGERSVIWLVLTSGIEPQIPSTSSLPPKEQNQGVTATYDILEVDRMIAEARRNYQLVKLAKGEKPELVLVNDRWLESLIESAQNKFRYRTPDAGQVAQQALYETRNATKQIVDKLVGEVEYRFSKIKGSELQFDGMKPTLPESTISAVDQAYGSLDFNLQLDQNTTALESRILELKSYQNSGDSEKTVILALEILDELEKGTYLKSQYTDEIKDGVQGVIASGESKTGRSLNQAADYYQQGKYGDAYYSAKNELQKQPFIFPWWAGAVALLGIMVVTLYSFREKLKDARSGVHKKIEHYKKKVEDEEMGKYNF